MLFGQSIDGSATCADLVARYSTVLAGGGNAGRYAPSPAAPADDLRAWQQGLVSDCGSAVAALRSGVEAWNQIDLDRCRLPHPLLGLLTIREMLFFTLHHYEHHRLGVSRRLATAASAS